MFKKIHSNRDPRDTLYSELKKEFSVYFETVTRFGKRIVCGHPRIIFGLMVFLLLASGITTIAFHWVFLQPGKTQKAIPIAKPVNDGFGQILKTSAALKETIRLKQEVDGLTAKKILNKADSAELLNDLDSLQRIRITINH